jgi:hypothetical protein
MKNIKRPILWLGLSLAIFVLAGSDQSAVADPLTGGNVPYEDCAPPCATSGYVLPPRCNWYFQTDAIALRREVLNGPIVFATYGPAAAPGTDPTNNIWLSNRELDLPFRAGARLLLGHTFGDTRYQLEASYFKIDNWDSWATITDNSPNAQGGTGNLFSRITFFGNPPQSPYDFSDSIAVRSISSLQNCEINLKYAVPMINNGFRASLLLGLRYMDIEEQFQYASTTDTVLPPATSATGFNMDTRTTNALLGPQIGGYFEFFSIPHSWVTFGMKGAICGNEAGHSIPSLGDDFRRDRMTTAFVGDLELMFNWQVTNHCIARFGYQAIWVDGLAIATTNFGQVPGVPQSASAVEIDTGGNSVYHGPHLGVEISW